MTKSDSSKPEHEKKHSKKKARQRAERTAVLISVLERSEERLATFSHSLEQAMTDASDQLERVVDSAAHEAARALECVERLVADARMAIDVHVDDLSEVGRSFGQRLDAQICSLTGELESSARASLVTLEGAFTDQVREAASHAASQATVADEQAAEAIGRAARAAESADAAGEAAEAAAIAVDAITEATAVLTTQFEARLARLDAEVDTRAREVFASLDALEQLTNERSAAAERITEPPVTEVPPVAHLSGTEQRTAEQPAADLPGTELPVTELPVTRWRASEAPVDASRLVAEHDTAVATATRRAWGRDRFSTSIPVRVVTQLGSLDASARALARTAADQRVRIEVVHRSVPGSALGSFMRLTVHDGDGCWEYHDIAAQADSLAPRAAVLDLPEVLDALDALRQYDASTADVHLVIDNNVTIGNTLLLARQDLDPELSFDRKRIERIDVHAAGRDGLALETQLGRVDVPPRLISLLRSRQASEVELIMVDGRPCVSAVVAPPSVHVSATIVARLPDAADQSSGLAHQRRQHPGDEIAHLVSALSADTTADELARILAVGVGYTRRLAAAHPNLPTAIIDEIVADGTDAMRAAAASNPSIGAEATARAADDQSPLVRAAIAGNARIEAAPLSVLAVDSDAGVRARAAANPVMTPPLLRQLADDEDAHVRVAVAAHSATEADVMTALAGDVDPEVCATLARNPNCPLELLNDLAAVVPEAVMASSHAPAALLTAGSKIQSATLRRTVAGNPATPAKVLDALSRDDDADVLQAVLENPSALATARRRATRRLDGLAGADTPAV